MKKFGTVLIAAAAFAALGSAARAEEKPLVAQKPPATVKAPDLLFQEVQVHYPDLNRSVRLVPPGGPSQTSVLRLVENTHVAQGTALGPDDPSGASGPVAVRSCAAPLKASLRVWVKNAGNASFNANMPPDGLMGHVGAASILKAWGIVAAGGTANFEVGALSLAPGTHAFDLHLNKAHAQEKNFANNDFEGSFQITCEKAAMTAAPAAPK